jgi:hypothetical protein
MTAAAPLFAVLLTLAQAPAAEPSAAAPAAGAPVDVVVGIWVNQIHEVSLKENYFVADFYVWFRWKGDALKPQNSFALVDGRIESKTEAITRKLPNGENYAYVRVVARMTKFWNVENFPLDNHQLALIVEEEDSENDKLRYQIDAVNSGTEPRITVPGWTLAEKETVAGLGTYRSNFGDVSLPTGDESSYARATLSMTFNREGTNYFAKLFFGLWVAVAISFLAFFIKPTDVDPRFGLGVGAIFAAIASEYIVTSSLPDTNIITLADWLHLVAFGFIFVSIAQSTWSLWLMQNGHEAKSKKLDKIFVVLLPTAYAVTNILLIALR